MSIRASRLMRSQIHVQDVNEILLPDNHGAGAGADMSDRTNDVPTCQAGMTRQWHRFAAVGTQRRGRRECVAFGHLP